MKPSTVLISTNSDLKRLPLDASEVFLLSRLDGELTLEEIGEVSGLGFEKARRLAERLVILQAARPIGDDRPAAPPPPREREARPKPRIDPRAEAISIPPPAPPREEAGDARPKRRPSRAVRIDTPDRIRSSPTPPKKETRRSTKSQRAVVVDICEIEPAMQERIRVLDASLVKLDHYGVLGVARDTDKKEIKRAYFALAGTFHPDRFFGKKLGPLRAALDRVFIRLTEANDALASNARREAYDATLPPLPKAEKKKSEPPRGEEKKVEEKKLEEKKVEEKKVEEKRPSKTIPAVATARLSPTPQKTSKRLRRSQLMAAAAAPAPPSTPTESDAERFRRLQGTARMLAGQTRAATWIKAAEDAIRAGDIIGAANNYRLALEMHDDPAVRDKLAAIETHSRDLRHEKSIARARAAERAERWAEAADHYIRANTVRREAVAAERAAYALRMSNGDLKLAISLAEQAIEFARSNADYRVTLGEVYWASQLNVRAKEECDAALELSPKNPRALALAEALKKR